MVWFTEHTKRVKRLFDCKIASFSLFHCRYVSLIEINIVKLRHPVVVSNEVY